MKTSPAGLSLIKRFEGLRTSAYLCPAGVPTIGYGHTADVRMGDTCTETQADDWLQRDCYLVEYLVSGQVLGRLEQHQFDALVSFAFNVGPGKEGVKDGFVWLKSGRKSTLLTLVNRGDFLGAADQFKFWNHASGKVLPGLTARRAAEAAMFLGQGVRT